MSTPQSIRVGVAGLGYWGYNVARNLAELPGCELVSCCDLDGDRRMRRKVTFPSVRFTADFCDLVGDESLDAIVIATPVATHAALAELALAGGKHCFVEKPLARRVDDAKHVAALAAERDLILMVGHLLAYHPATMALKDLCGSGELGEIRYIYSQRLNLGKLRTDENALWSLGAHDISAMLELTSALPSEVSGRGASYVRDGVEDVVFGHLAFPGGIAGHIHVSWLDPRKERRMTVVGSQRMAIFDDMAPADRMLTVYDKGFDPDALVEGEYVARSGQERHVSLSTREPLRIELEHFLDCVREGIEPRTSGEDGLRVVRVLAALQESLEAGGATVSLAPLGSRA